MFFAIGGGIDTWFVLVPIMVHLHWWFLPFGRLGSFLLIFFLLPFLGALFYWQLASFHHWGQNRWHRTNN
jgi:hypothetical protein